MEVTQEQLKNMSPEEIRELQKKQCIFCAIISGKMNAKKIFEDEFCTAVLDINPASPGHVLLMTNEHYMIMPQVPEEEIKHVFMVAKALSSVLLKALQIQGTNIMVSNGFAAGQKAQHFMVHIIPRNDGDDVGLNPANSEVPEDMIGKLTNAIRPRLLAALGIRQGVTLQPEPVQEPEPAEEPEVQEATPEPEDSPQEQTPAPVGSVNLDVLSSILNTDVKKIFSSEAPDEQEGDDASADPGEEAEDEEKDG